MVYLLSPAKPSVLGSAVVSGQGAPLCQSPGDDIAAVKNLWKYFISQSTLPNVDTVASATT